MINYWSGITSGRSQKWHGINDKVKWNNYSNVNETIVIAYFSKRKCRIDWGNARYSVFLKRLLWVKSTKAPVRDRPNEPIRVYGFSSSRPNEATPVNNAIAATICNTKLQTILKNSLFMTDIMSRSITSIYFNQAIIHIIITTIQIFDNPKLWQFKGFLNYTLYSSSETLFTSILL